MSIRPVKRLIRSKPTTEGAGVHLRRAFGFSNTSEFGRRLHHCCAPVAWGEFGDGEPGSAEHAGGMLYEGDVEGGAGEEAGAKDC